jgi:glycosyltransferase EpsE
MDAKVAVIMSTYNAQQYIDSCLQSLAEQTYKDFEVHIIDDHSDDDTVSVIRRWCCKDQRFKLVDVHQSNQGLTKTLNELLAVTSTEYIARMDADDLAEPERLSKQVTYLEEHRHISVVGSWAQDTNEHGEPAGIRKVPLTPEDIRRMVTIACPMIHPTVLFRRADILSVGGYDERYRYAQDYDLWFRCLGSGLQLANLPETLLKYRVEANHVKKRGMKHRLLDARIRWRGSKRLGLRFPRRVVTTAIPIMLGLMPNFVKRIFIRFKHVLDPRQRTKPESEVNESNQHQQRQ